MGTWAVSWTRALGAVTLGVAALVACGDDDDAGESAADAEAAVVETSAAPVTTVAPETTEPAPETTAASETTEPAPETTEPAPETTEAPATTAAPETTAAASTAQTMPTGRLTGGKRYRVPPSAATITTSLSFEVTPPADGLYGFTAAGFAGISRDEPGTDPLLEVVALERVEAIKDPVLDLANVNSFPQSPDQVEPVPADVLAWFAGRPGVTAGEVSDVTFGGVPARQMSYQVAAVPGAPPCDPTDPSSPPCMGVFNMPCCIHTVAAGQVGSLYEVVTETGARVLFVVADGEGSQQLVDSVAITFEAD